MGRLRWGGSLYKRAIKFVRTFAFNYLAETCTWRCICPCLCWSNNILLFITGSKGNLFCLKNSIPNFLLSLISTLNLDKPNFHFDWENCFVCKNCNDINFNLLYVYAKYLFQNKVLLMNIWSWTTDLDLKIGFNSLSLI